MAASGASEGGDHDSAASPSRSAGSGESVGTKWPPLPLQGCSAGTLPRAIEQALPSRERGGVRTVSLPSRKSALERGEGSEPGPGADELSYIATGNQAAPARALFPVPSHAGVRAA